MVEYLSIHMGQRFSRYPHYVFGYVYNSPKTSSAGIFALDDFPHLSEIRENHTANTAAIDRSAIYQHYVFGNFSKSPKTSSVGILQIIPNHQVRD